MGIPPAPPYRKLVVNVENPCASLCINHSRNLLAVVGRKGKVWSWCMRGELERCGHYIGLICQGYGKVWFGLR